MYQKFEERKPYELLDTSKYPPEVAGRFNSFITTQFDDSLSVEMQMRSIIKWAIDNFKEMDETYNNFTDFIVGGSINPFIEFLNDLIEYMNEFIDTFDTKFQEEILKNLQHWNDDGTLETLINESLDTKYHEMDEKFTSQLAQTKSDVAKKPDKTETGWATLNILTEEERSKLLGLEPGELNAVLGEGNVIKENIGNKQIELEKTSDSLKQLLHTQVINSIETSVEVGSLGVGLGDELESDTRLRTGKVNSVEVVSLVDTLNYQMRVFEYGDSGIFTGIKSGWTTNDYVPTHGTVRVLIAFKDGSPIDLDDHNMSQINFYTKKLISNDELGDKVIGRSNIQENSVSGEHVDFVEVSSNLFDPERLVNKTYSLPEGVPADTYNWSSIDYSIPVSEGEEITSVGLERHQYWDGEGNYITGSENRQVDDPDFAFTTVAPKNAKFLIVSTTTVNLFDEVRVNRGSELLEYEPYYFNIPSLRLEDNQTGEEMDRPYYFVPEVIKDKLILKDGLYDYPSVSELYNDYQLLIDEHSDYITKTVLGADTTGDYEIWKLNLKAKEYDNNLAHDGAWNTNNLKNKRPKITFIAGIHGHEQGGVLATYNMVKALCEDWETDERLEYLRFNVEFEFIPVVYPSGYETDKYSNVTGVNLQTNFPYKFVVRDETSNVFGGTEPLTEIETVYCKQLIDDNQDSLFFMDLHSPGYSKGEDGGVDTLFYYLMSRTEFYNVDLETIAKHSIESTSRLLIKNYPIESNNLQGWITWRDGRGTADAYASSLDIPSFVLEVPQWSPYETEKLTSDAIKISTEVLMNNVLIALKRYKDIY